jgi:hypothetical protein
MVILIATLTAGLVNVAMVNITSNTERKVTEAAITAGLQQCVDKSSYGYHTVWQKDCSK